jgi:hypothetical protein
VAKFHVCVKNSKVTALSVVRFMFTDKLEDKFYYMVVSTPQSEYVSAAYTSLILKKVRSGRNNNKLLLND